MGLNALGLNVNDRRETWLFSELEVKQGKPVYRRLKWNVVTYGDDPEEFLEPVNAGAFDDLVGQPAPTSGVGRFTGIRLVKGKLCDVHSYDDYDASGHGYVDIAGRTPTGF